MWIADVQEMAEQFDLNSQVCMKAFREFKESQGNVASKYIFSMAAKDYKYNSGINAWKTELVTFYHCKSDPKHSPDVINRCSLRDALCLECLLKLKQSKPHVELIHTFHC